MKKQISIITTIFILLLTSCASHQKDNNTQLYNTKWELEYITGPRIAFEALFPDNKPFIQFNKSTQQIEGNNSCNGFLADYTLHKNNITIKETGVTTLRYCGQGETIFKNTATKINQYKIDADGKLNLLYNDVVMMRFKKMTP
ncbi:META domain-containing protein [Flavobacterium sp. UMI-01]|uniref:META domain-containing protein n=1 Tax=Flavobacterium sp. UMI-01 TaxID=1441053 RepID=UPI001C7E1C01|nr:META domain-containing protein [Flavobacterium sp. UMI-01]GIZ08548.1 hypothetical protein FUMI01_12750 [Flavobacterium sp. UMI-01]